MRKFIGGISSETTLLIVDRQPARSRNRVRTSAAGGRSAGRCARQDSTSALSSGAQFPGIGLRYPYATLRHTRMTYPAAQRRPAPVVPTLMASGLQCSSGRGPRRASLHRVSLAFLDGAVVHEGASIVRVYLGSEGLNSPHRVSLELLDGSVVCDLT